MKYEIMHFYNILKATDKIYIYGSGYYAKKLICWMTYLNWSYKVKNIIVTNKSVNPDKLEDIKVVEFEQIRKTIEDGMLVIAVSEDKIPEILFSLNGKLNIPVIAMKNEFINKIDDYIVREQFFSKLCKGDNKCLKKEVLLISPPDWDFNAPYSAIPCLQGALKQNNIGCNVLDIGIYAFHNRLQKKWKIISRNLLSKEFYQSLIEKYSDNCYSSYEDYYTDQWFFHGDEFPFNEVKEKYNELKKIQRAVLSRFYSAIIYRHHYLNESDVNESSYSIELQLKFLETGYLIDTLIDNYLLNMLSEYDIVGFSVTGLGQFLPACFLTSVVKKLNPSAKIIFGGRGAAIMYVGRAPSVKNDIFEYADFLMIGEGETCLSKLCKALLKGNNIEEYRNIGNLIYKMPDGEIIETFRYYEDIEQLPTPCFDGYDLSLYVQPHVVFPYLTSKGCYYGMCAFCDQENEYRHSYKTKSVQKAVNDLLNYYYKYDMRYFQLVDEAIEPKYFFELIEEMDKHDEFKECKWFCYSRVSMRYTEEILKKARRNGLEMVMFGVESFNDRVLKFVKKGITSQAILYTIKLFKQCGIKPFIWLLCGFPSETIDEIRDDIRIVDKNKESIANINVAQFFLDSKCDIYRNTKDYNIKSVGKQGYDFVHYDTNGKIINNKEIHDVFVNEYVPFQYKYYISNDRYFTFFE